MNKKLIIIISIIFLIFLVAMGVVIVLNTKSNNNITTQPITDNNLGVSVNEDNNSKEDKNDNNSSNKLVVYFSAQGHTKRIAQAIANNLNCDIMEVIPKDVYTESDLNYSDSNSRVSKEHNNPSLRNIELLTNTIENLEKYDTIFIGYPIWWGEAAWPMTSLISNIDFSGKTVIPFCTSASSSLGNSAKNLKEVEKGSGNWLEGKRFSSSASNSDIKNWTDSLK